MSTSKWSLDVDQQPKMPEYPRETGIKSLNSSSTGSGKGIIWLVVIHRWLFWRWSLYRVGCIVKVATNTCFKVLRRVYNVIFMHNFAWLWGHCILFSWNGKSTHWNLKTVGLRLPTSKIVRPKGLVSCLINARLTAFLIVLFFFFKTSYKNFTTLHQSVQ